MARSKKINWSKTFDNALGIKKRKKSNWEKLDSPDCLLAICDIMIDGSKKFAAGVTTAGIIAGQLSKKLEEQERMKPQKKIFYTYKENYKLADPNECIEKHISFRQENVKPQSIAIAKVLVNNKVNAQMEQIIQGVNTVRWIIRPGSVEDFKKLESLQFNFQIALNNDKTTVYRDGNRINIDMPMALDYVCLGDCINDEFYYGDGYTVALGMTIDKRCVYAEIEKLPHLLVAGTTGSGKTVLLHSMIMSLLLKKTAHELQLYLIDPKGTEFRRYPLHLPDFCYGAYDPNSAANMMNSLVNEMEDRYRILMNNGCRDIDSYNKKFPENKMSRKILFVDEMADLMLSDYGKEIEKNIVKLAQKARAAGIHLVLATQYPTVKVITGQIKANIAARIALKVATNVNSRVILDQSGAEKLLGHGDMLYLAGDGSDPVRIQAPLVKENEMDRLEQETQKNIKNYNDLYFGDKQGKKSTGFKWWMIPLIGLTAMNTLFWLSVFIAALAQ